MGDEMNSASNLDEFNEQARSFVTKARAKNLSNTAIANTINFMYGMYQNEQKNKITPYQQAQLDLERERMDMAKQQTQGADWKLADVNGDGTMEWVNTSSQQVKGTNFGTQGSDAYSLAMQGNSPVVAGTGALAGATGSTPSDQPVGQIGSMSQDAFLQPGQQGPMTELQTEGISQAEKAKKEAELKKKYEEEGVYGAAVKPFIMDQAKNFAADPIGMSRAYNPQTWIPDAAGRIGESAIKKLGEVAFGKKGPQL